jgi:flagellar motor switch protein FliG
MQRLRSTLTLILLVLGLTSQARAESRLQQVQDEVEKQVKAMLREQLGAGEFLVYAVVKRSGPEAETKDAALPFSPVQIAPGLLKDILVSKYGQDNVEDLLITVTLTLDQRLPEAKRQLLKGALDARFGFDGQKRTLEVKTAELVSTPIADAERFEIERAKMEAEKARVEADKARMETDQARLRLETEQARLEVKKKDIELTEMTAKVERSSQQAPPTAAGMPAAATPAPGTPQTLPDGSPAPAPVESPSQVSASVALFKDFQLTAMALVLGLIIIVAILVGGSFFIRGLSPLSSAIATIGASIESASKNSGGSTTQVTAVAGGGGGDGDAHEDHGGGGKGKGEAVVAGAPQLSEAFLRDQEAFVSEVQAKVDILSREKNFSFYRIFAEMIESRAKLPLAASILVSLGRDTARSIVADLSAEQIAGLRGFLNSEGGLIKAKELKIQALSEFYGQIAMAEFQNSPLMELKDLSWLTKKSTPELAKFLCELTDEERPIFLACLSPERVLRVLEVEMDANDRALILRSVAMITQVTEDAILPAIAGIAARVAQPSGPREPARPAVDGAKYIAAVAADLVESDQKALFDVIKDDKELIEDVRQYYIPFSNVRMLPKELLLEIFGDRADQQIAVILFDASPEVREAVIGCLQEIRAESVKDELKVLDEDKFYKKRNQKASAKMQREIGRYLQTLYAEGLVSFEARPGAAKTGEDYDAGSDAA